MQLLDRLKQIDPTTYKRYNTDKIICDMELAIAVKDAWLQSCLQEAISDKGYMFSVSHIWPNASLPAYQWKARIFIDPDNIIERRSDLPARALLGAYIAACEATHDST